MAISTSQIRDMLLPGIDKITGEYNQLASQADLIFESHTSDMNFERDVEVKLLGAAQQRYEGEATNYEDMGERYVSVYRHVQLALGFIMTRIAIEDNLYKSQFNPNMRALKNSMKQGWEILAANVLNFGTDTTGNYYGGDGVSLLSTAHPIDTGTVANTFTVPAQLNETSLQDAITGIRRFRDAAGLTAEFKVDKLVIPPEGQFVADRILKTTDRVGTTDNDRNVINANNLVPGGVVMNYYLTDINSWYLLSDCPDGLKCFKRTPFKMDMFVDPDTDNLKTKATERRSYGWSNFRGIFGSMP